MKLEILKSLLGIEEADQTKDVQLEFAIGDVKEIVTNYCNIAEVPQGLTNTGYRMAIDIYRNEQLGRENRETVITSLSEGDTSVSYKVHEQASDFKESLLKSYSQQLNKYRKVAFR